MKKKLTAMVLALGAMLGAFGAWNGNLSTLKGDATAASGTVITGTLIADVNVSIAAGATVTLQNANITNTTDYNYSGEMRRAGITCIGDATIILAGTNTVKGMSSYGAGIFVPEGNTLTIKGSGLLAAYAGGVTSRHGAGIGCMSQRSCGNIVVEDGTIIADGGYCSAGIGSYNGTTCGTITISGGNVVAKGGMYGAGIGTAGSSCAGIIISGGVVTAEGGEPVTDETVVSGDATYYAHWGRPAATFAAGAVSSSESKTVKLTVYGGSLTGPSSGKISGKVLEGGRTWSLSASYFERAEVLEPLEQLEPLEPLDNRLVFHATVIAKSGKLLATNEIAVAAVDGIGVLTGTFELSNSQTFELSSYQNLWKRADTKAAQPVFKKNIVVEYYPLGVSGDKNNTVKFTFKKDGAVSFSGKIGGVSVSGSAQIVWVSGALGKSALQEGWYMTVYAPPKPKAKPPFDGWCETFPVRLTLEENIVTKVEIGDEPEMVQLWEGGPYWATKNIGAKKPEDSGYYFWWGDTLGYK